MADDPGAPASSPLQDIATISLGTATQLEQAAPTGPRLPVAIGRYKVIGLIGEGGMGSVYEAEQEHPRRIVALKVIKPGFANVELLRRFERESQVLARLQHPGIAQIYEAGAAATGFGPQPHFAMEFIHGVPLREYADAHQLSTRQRLELIAKVCDAVEHAHQRGIIHRDLKPGNILVDEAGQPKILDFGVARVTDSDVQATRQTDVGQLIGTLAYMSPEQVTADPLELDTRSDVYALGVILYELLANRLPYQLSQQLPEAVRAIREEDPTKLSSISRAYRGDVETIVAKALEKDKGRRYSSAAALAADIRRYLADEPIMARPASTSYQLRKFARRHKALVIATAAVLAVLVAGVIVSTREAVRARRAEQTAQAVNDFLQNDLLAQASVATQASPNTKPDPDLKVRTALDRAAAKIGDRFAKQPLVEASIRETIAHTYRDLGLYMEGQRQVERALELRRRFQGELNSDTLAAMSELAAFYTQRAKFTDAEGLLRKILPLRRRVSGNENALTASLLDDLATVYEDEGKYAEAEPLYLQAIEIDRRLFGESNPSTFNAMSDLGILYRKEGKYRKAEEIYTKVLEIKRRVLGDEHPDTLTSMNTLGIDYYYENRYPQAEVLLKKTLDSRRRVLGAEHPSTLLTMNNLGLAYVAEGENAEAEELLRETFAARLRVSGPEHADTLLAAINLGEVYINEGKYREADALVTSALETSRRVYGTDHPQTEQLMRMLGRLRELEGKSIEAEALFTAALESRARVLGKEHPTTLRTAMDLGHVRAHRREYGLAEAIFRTTLMSYENTQPESWSRYACESQLGASLAAQGRYDAAERLLLSGYEGMYQQRDSISASNRYYLVDAQRALVNLYKDWRKPEKAAQWERALQP